MKTIALTLFAAALGLAQSATSPPAARAAGAAPKTRPQIGTTARNKKAPPSKPTQDQTAKAQSQAQSIPAGATQVEPNLYRYTDSNGKTWNYRQTPFGISKWEDTSSPAAEPASQPKQAPTQVKTDPVKVTELGDSYRFERKTPFGTSTWVRKKSELTDEEKILSAGRETTPSDPNRNSLNGKPAGNQ